MARKNSTVSYFQEKLRASNRKAVAHRTGGIKAADNANFVTNYDDYNFVHYNFSSNGQLFKPHIFTLNNEDDRTAFHYEQNEQALLSTTSSGGQVDFKAVSSSDLIEIIGGGYEVVFDLNMDTGGAVASNLAVGLVPFDFKLTNQFGLSIYDNDIEDPDFSITGKDFVGLIMGMADAAEVAKFACYFADDPTLEIESLTLVNGYRTFKLTIQFEYEGNNASITNPNVYVNIRHAGTYQDIIDFNGYELYSHHFNYADARNFGSTVYSPYFHVYTLDGQGQTSVSLHSITIWNLKNGIIRAFD